MPKRASRAISNDEREATTSANSSKRARLSEDVDAPESSPPPASMRERRQSKRSRKTRTREEDGSDEEMSGADVEEELEEEEEDPEQAASARQQAEEEYAEQVRQSVEEKKKHAGGIAEYGIIHSVEMHQFMCHKFLSFTFGPQINFIIGHNGSGKSAVLTAITVGLGGKATTTGRGNGLKSFIREGQSAAEVTVVLKNETSEAYKPQTYGDKIKITRKFTKDGSSTWKICDKHGKVVSTKRDELTAILDYMNIQVDNPMNILTQDTARQFLSASTPHDKYMFFLKGTQLQQLSEEYDSCLENIHQTARILGKKREVIPDLREAFKQASRRLEEAKRAVQQRSRMDDLKRELAWAHVKSKEDEMTKQLSEVAKLERRVPKIRAELDNCLRVIEDTTRKVTEHEEKIGQLGDISDLTTQQKELKDELRKGKDTLLDLKRNEDAMNKQMTRLNSEITELEQRIADETKKLEINTQEKRDDTQRKLALAEAELAEAERHLTDVNAQQRTKLADSDSSKSARQNAAEKCARLDEQLKGCKAQMERCRQAEGGHLNSFGNNMKQLLDSIQAAKWYGRTPVGPLGAFVKVKDPEVWAPLMRVQLGMLLTRFAVTDARDRGQLKQMLNGTGNKHCDVVISEYDLFDYSHGEPPAHVPTVLRALEVASPKDLPQYSGSEIAGYVLRILINIASIERIVIAKQRKEADDSLRSFHGGGIAWSADLFRVQKYAEGGGSSVPLNPLKQSDPRQLFFTTRDVTSQLRDLERQHAGLEEQLLSSQREEQQFQNAVRECSAQIQALKNQEKAAHTLKGQKKLQRDNLRNEANDEVPPDVAGLGEAKEDAMQEKENIRIQFRDLVTQKEDINGTQGALMNELLQVKDKIRQYEEQRQGIAEQLQQAAEARVQAQGSKKHYESKIAVEEQRIADEKESANVLEQEFEMWTEKASEFCDPVENPRKVDELEREIKSVQRALKDREADLGATVDEMVVAVNRTKHALDTVTRELKEMFVLNKALKASLNYRIDRWEQFRRHIALRTKIIFQYHLSQRGYFGRIMFEHEKETLEIKVQTEDNIAGTQSKEKDAKTLSGGEKSFSTICLLLALWEAIGCPIRCLDEFDVFMDAVNRRISMKMIIETATSSDRKQYILITPQDMGNVKIGPTVRVNRMTDPERNQGTLAFGR